MVVNFSLRTELIRYILMLSEMESKIKQFLGHRIG